MGTVVENVRSANSGLNEAYTSLLACFEICDIIYLQKDCLYIDSSP